MDGSLTAKKAFLARSLEATGAVVVAYSGGVDSTFLAASASEVLGDRSVAVTAVSPSMPERELAAAREVAAARGWRHEVVRTHEVEREEYARNAPDRCYWCKAELFDVLEPLAGRLHARIVVGTNVDDLGDVRPGHRAARERGVGAPLVEAGLTKAEIRTLSAEMGLPTAEKPAGPCLASRFAYGIRVTPEGLRRIDRAEDEMRRLGFVELRVRDHGDLARVEVPSAEIRRAAELSRHITQALKAQGYRYVTLDLDGFRSGSMNEALGPPTIRPS